MRLILSFVIEYPPSRTNQSLPDNHRHWFGFGKAVKKKRPRHKHDRQAKNNTAQVTLVKWETVAQWTTTLQNMERLLSMVGITRVRGWPAKILFLSQPDFFLTLFMKFGTLDNQPTILSTSVPSFRPLMSSKISSLDRTLMQYDDT